MLPIRPRTIAVVVAGAVGILLLGLGRCQASSAKTIGVLEERVRVSDSLAAFHAHRADSTSRLEVRERVVFIKDKARSDTSIQRADSVQRVSDSTITAYDERGEAVPDSVWRGVYTSTTSAYQRAIADLQTSLATATRGWGLARAEGADLRAQAAALERANANIKAQVVELNKQNRRSKMQAFVVGGVVGGVVALAVK